MICNIGFKGKGIYSFSCSLFPLRQYIFKVLSYIVYCPHLLDLLSSFENCQPLFVFPYPKPLNLFLLLHKIIWLNDQLAHVHKNISGTLILFPNTMTAFCYHFDNGYDSKLILSECDICMICTPLNKHS